MKNYYVQRNKKLTTILTFEMSHQPNISSLTNSDELRMDLEEPDTDTDTEEPRESCPTISTGGQDEEEEEEDSLGRVPELLAEVRSDPKRFLRNFIIDYIYDKDLASVDLLVNTIDFAARLSCDRCSCHHHRQVTRRIRSSLLTALSLLIAPSDAEERLVEAISLDRHNYFALSAAGREGTITHLLDGTSTSPVELFREVIRMDPEEPIHYHWAGDVAVTVCGKTVVEQQQQYLQAIALDTTFAASYFGLYNTLSEGETIGLWDGTVMTKRQLLIKVISLDPNNSSMFKAYYFDLGRTLPFGQVELLDGTTMTQQQLFLKQISLNPTVTQFFFYLAVTLPVGEDVVLLDGTVMNQQQLYLKAISLDPTHVSCFNNLANTLSWRGEQIQLLDGTTMTKHQLFLQGHALDPDNKVVSRNLGLSDMERNTSWLDIR
jgi:hypothetical protein